MKRLWIWIILLLSILVACSPDSLIPPEPVMQDGVWTGNGEGRSGTILVRITVLGHRITNIVVVSQSESSFAQDAINMAIRSALGQGDSGKTIYKDGSCDVVIVGAGGAGLTAAVQAASSGDLRIIVLEKQGILGGNTNYSTGGVHGANRLGGNGVADIVVNGKIAGQNAAEYAR